MVLCAVCSASRPPMSSLSSEQMKAFEAVVSQFVNLEPLIKSHTILMCPPCMDQIEMVCKFQTAAVAGIKRLLSFLQEHDQRTSDRMVTVTVSIKPEPLETFEVKQEPEDLETKTLEPSSPTSVAEEIAIKCEPDMDLTEKLATESQIQETEIATEAAKENNTAQRGSTPVQTELVNETKMVTFTHKPATVLTNGNTEFATASTSKLALQTQINSSTSALLKCNIYDPKFLNKYFSESRDSSQPETLFNKESNMAKSSDNSVTMPNGHVSTAASSASLCTPLPNFSGLLSASAATNQVNSQKQKSYRTKQIVNCDICDATFLSKRFMEIHSRTKHGVKKPSVNVFCEACGVTSRTAAAHKAHIASVHSAAARDQWKFRCDECTRKFPTKGRLEEHKERMHVNKTKSTSERVVQQGCGGGARRHRCEACGAGFAFRSALHAHGKLMHGKPAQRKRNAKGGNNGKKGNVDKNDNAQKKGNDGEKRG